jgi:hypothetical protein
MSSDAWPSSDAPPSPLPRIEDLPVADQGYDQEAVRLAFDSFYRHAAQLDASLRALEAVEVFRRDADALRNDLRALRALGLGGGAAEPPWATPKYERAARPGIPGVVLRLAAEFALIVAVAVIAGTAHLRAGVIVALMSAAFVIVAFSEWLATRTRFVPPPAVAFYSAETGEPAPYVEVPAPGWEPAAVEHIEDTEPEALTVIEASGAEAVDPWERKPEPASDEAEVVNDEPELTDDEPELTDDEPESESESEPELAERGGIFRRRRR